MWMYEDLIAAMREFVETHDAKESYSAEINCWREKFLSRADLPKDPDESLSISIAFLSIPSSDFIGKTPEQWLQICKKNVS